MKIDIPYEIGDKINVGGTDYTVEGIHIYVTKDGSVAKWRFHVGGGVFVTVNNDEDLIPREGKWISEIVKLQDWKGRIHEYYRPNSCSVCHEASVSRSNYCPNCGKKMRLKTKGASDENQIGV